MKREMEVARSPEGSLRGGLIDRQKGKEAQPDQDTLDIVWESLSDAVGRNDGIAHGTDTARYLIEALAERGMCVASIGMRDALNYYARACDVAASIENADRGDFDVANATEAFAEDCGELARAALKTPRE